MTGRQTVTKPSSSWRIKWHMVTSCASWQAGCQVSGAGTRSRTLPTRPSRCSWHSATTWIMCALTASYSKVILKCLHMRWQLYECKYKLFMGFACGFACCWLLLFVVAWLRFAHVERILAIVNRVDVPEDDKSKAAKARPGPSVPAAAAAADVPGLEHVILV